MKPKKETFAGIDRLIHEENKRGPREGVDDYMSHGKKNNMNDKPDRQQMHERGGNDK